MGSSRDRLRNPDGKPCGTPAAGCRSPTGRGSDPEDWKGRSPVTGPGRTRRRQGSRDGVRDREYADAGRRRGCRRDDPRHRLRGPRNGGPATTGAVRCHHATFTPAAMTATRRFAGHTHAGEEKGRDEDAAERHNRQPSRPGDRAVHPTPSDHGPTEVSTANGAHKRATRPGMETRRLDDSCYCRG